MKVETIKQAAYKKITKKLTDLEASNQELSDKLEDAEVKNYALRKTIELFIGHELDEAEKICVVEELSNAVTVDEVDVLYEQAKKMVRRKSQESLGIHEKEDANDIVYTIANICTELTKINSQGRNKTCYSLGQVKECFDCCESGIDVGEYYTKLERMVRENGSCEHNGVMISHVKQKKACAKLLWGANKINNECEQEIADHVLEMLHGIEDLRHALDETNSLFLQYFDRKLYERYLDSLHLSFVSNIGEIDEANLCIICSSAMKFINSAMCSLHKNEFLFNVLNDYLGIISRSYEKINHILKTI